MPTSRTDHGAASRPAFDPCGHAMHNAYLIDAHVYLLFFFGAG
jgi:hypothetical protein